MKPKETDYEKLVVEMNAYMKQQEEERIEKALVIEHLKKRLIESAIENVGYKCDASDVFEDIAKNRIDIWINELYVGNVLGREHPVWIPCSERLPRRDEQDDELGVLVTLGNGYDGLEYDKFYEATQYDEAHWYDWDGYVIAWRPLPEPYRGD